MQTASQRARHALVVGGGGPTGPPVVNGLLERGYQVTVLNTGRHPVEYDGAVERLVADPNFIEPLEAALQGRHFDVAVAQYGRLRLVAQALAGRTEHLIAIGGMFYPGWIDPAATVRPSSETGEARDWKVTYLDDAQPMRETTPLDPIGKMGQRVVEADADVRARHAKGDFIATLLRYPRVYGPRQPGAAEWSIIRRILDGRRRILVPEGGFIIQSVLYVENAARIVLSAIENQGAAAGQIFNCADAEPITHRKWINTIASAMGVEVELVSVPMAAAQPAWPYARFPLSTGHHILDTRKLFERLPHDSTPFLAAMRKTVDWYLQDPEGRGRIVEPQLADPFRYDIEDALIRELDAARDRIAALEMPALDMAHTYAHPKAPPSPGGAP
jgi:nucleoside-diphosphate-sugar epimerase